MVVLEINGNFHCKSKCHIKIKNFKLLDKYLRNGRFYGKNGLNLFDTEFYWLQLLYKTFFRKIDNKRNKCKFPMGKNFNIFCEISGSGGSWAS